MSIKGTALPLAFGSGMYPPYAMWACPLPLLSNPLIQQIMRYFNLNNGNIVDTEYYRNYINEDSKPAHTASWSMSTHSYELREG